MKAFTYSLEKVLRLRKYYEDEAKIELGKVVGTLAEIENKLFATAEEIGRAQAAQFNPQNTAADMQQYMFYLLRLDSNKEQLLKEAALAEIKVEEAREVFIEASRERKVLDNLKDKRYKEYRKMALLEETKTLDDISASRARM